MHKAYCNWSSGKDASLALYTTLQEGILPVEKLATTFSKDYNRVSLHGVRVELVEAQAKSLQIPLHKIEIPTDTSMESYNAVMNAEMQQLISQGFTHSIFGDIFLEDLKQYRENQLKKVSIKGVFPLWKKDTKQLVKKMLELGFKAIVTCVDASKLDKSFVGRIIDEQFLKDFPVNVDPCGENGEFHTFVFNGPIFNKPIAVTKGEVVLKEYKNNDSNSWNSKFWYQDLLLTT